MTVFISSSIPEFAEIRKKLKSELATVGFLTPIVLEVEGAKPESVESISIRLAGESDIFVGIFGKLYSPLVMKEYAAAKEKGKPRFVYIHDVEASPEVREFIEHGLTDITYQRFETTEDVVSFIVRDLDNFVADVLREGIEGWVQKHKGRPPEIETLPEEPRDLAHRAKVGLEKWAGGVHEGGVHLGPVYEEPQRIRILKAIAGRPWSTTKYLVEATGIYGAILWLRLSELENKGMVTVTRYRKRNLYKITKEGLDALTEWNNEK